MNTIKKNWKRYLISSIDSFLAGFTLTFGYNLSLIPIGDFDALKAAIWGSFIGACFAGIRAVLKMIREKAQGKLSA